MGLNNEATVVNDMDIAIWFQCGDFSDANYAVTALLFLGLCKPYLRTS